MKSRLKKLPTSKKTYVKESGLHGLGVFAKRNIKKGEIVFIIKGLLKKWLVRNEKEANYGENWVGIGKNLWIDPTGTGRYLNHSAKPTCGIRGRVTVCALRNIKKDEEITVDYSITEEQVLWGLQVVPEHGTKKRIVIRSIQSMPINKYKSYLPYIPRYFQKIYRDHHKIDV